MRKELIERYIELSAILLAPIIPHTSEYIWRNLLKRQGSVFKAGWPQTPSPNLAMQRASQYIEGIIPAMRKMIVKMEAPPKNKKGAVCNVPRKVTHGQVFVGERYIGWQEAVLLVLQRCYSGPSKGFSSNVMSEVLQAVKSTEGMEGLDDKRLKSLVMPFTKYKMEEAQEGGLQVRHVRVGEATRLLSIHG